VPSRASTGSVKAVRRRSSSLRVESGERGRRRLRRHPGMNESAGVADHQCVRAAPAASAEQPSSRRLSRPGIAPVTVQEPSVEKASTRAMRRRRFDLQGPDGGEPRQGCRRQRPPTTGTTGGVPALLLRLVPAQQQLTVRPSLGVTIVTHPARQPSPFRMCPIQDRWLSRSVGPSHSGPVRPITTAADGLGVSVIDKGWSGSPGASRLLSGPPQRRAPQPLVFGGTLALQREVIARERPRVFMRHHPYVAIRRACPVTMPIACTHAPRMDLR
jgi:hypothetical protein